MGKIKIIFLGLLGALFFLLGLYYQEHDPARSISYWYLGTGTWSAAVLYYALLHRYKEITSFLFGLLILHAGVLLILTDKPSNPKLLGFLVFTSGVVVVLGSGLSDYLRRKKAD